MGPQTYEASVCEEDRRTWCLMVLFSDFTRSIDEAARVGAASSELLVRVRHQWLGGKTRQACATTVLHGRLRSIHVTGIHGPPSDADIHSLLLVSKNAIHSRLKAPQHLQRGAFR